MLLDMERQRPSRWMAHNASAPGRAWQRATRVRLPPARKDESKDSKDLKDLKEAKEEPEVTDWIKEAKDSKDDKDAEVKINPDNFDPFGTTNLIVLPEVAGLRAVVADLAGRLATLESRLGAAPEPFIGAELRPDLVGGPDYPDPATVEERMRAADPAAKREFDAPPGP